MPLAKIKYVENQNHLESNVCRKHVKLINFKHCKITHFLSNIKSEKFTVRICVRIYLPPSPFFDFFPFCFCFTIYCKFRKNKYALAFLIVMIITVITTTIAIITILMMVAIIVIIMYYPQRYP